MLVGLGSQTLCKVTAAADILILSRHSHHLNICSNRLKRALPTFSSLVTVTTAKLHVLQVSKQFHHHERLETRESELKHKIGLLNCTSGIYFKATNVLYEAEKEHVLEIKQPNSNNGNLEKSFTSDFTSSMAQKTTENDLSEATNPEKPEINQKQENHPESPEKYEGDSIGIKKNKQNVKINQIMILAARRGNIKTIIDIYESEGFAFNQINYVTALNLLSKTDTHIKYHDVVKIMIKNSCSDHLLNVYTPQELGSIICSLSRMKLTNLDEWNKSF